MAKKKETEQELSQEELEAKFSTTEEDNAVSDKKKPKVKTKATFSLTDYKKAKSSTVSFKPQTWIKMSPAYQELTGLPGIPEGHLSMIYGKSDVGKTTMLLELAKYSQEQGILPIFVITEKKWSWERCEEMGIDAENCIFRDDFDTIEDACDFVQEVLLDQLEGRLPQDIVFLWDSVGATPSRKEFEKQEEGEGGGGMMVTARVLRERISRNIMHRITNTRKESFPYSATLFVVNHAYQAPPSFPGGQTTLKPYGGDGIYYSATLVFRQGGIMSNSSKVKATKDGNQVSFAIKSALVIEKNHITNVSAEGKILCTAHGFLQDDKDAINEYKKKYKDGWSLEFDSNWNKVSKE
jgi:RecA/RadA recombinase